MGIRTTKWARMSRLGGLAASIAGGAAGAAGGAVRRGREAARERFHRDTAERLTATLGQMKGLPQKLGQALSTLDAVLPEDQRSTYRDVLGRLQAHSEPLPWTELEAEVEKALGAPLADCFEELEPTAVAAASIGQVHRAWLHDGRPVAVKVQYPGVEEALQADLEQVGLLVRSLSAVLPKTDVRPLLEDVVATFLEEVDYAHEAQVQQACRRRWVEDPAILIPAVVESHCGERVLTSGWVDGLEVEAAEQAPQELRDQWGRALWRFTWTSITEHGWIHGDPHPGNLRFLHDGRLAVLDFGASAELPERLSGGLARAARLSGEGASEEVLLGCVLGAVGLPLDLAPDVAGPWGGFSRLLFKPMRSDDFRFSEDYVRALLGQVQAAKAAAAKTAIWKGMPTPSTKGTVLLMRTAIGQAAVLARLRASVAQ